MDNSYPEVRRYPATVPADARSNGWRAGERRTLDRHLADQPGDGRRWLDVLGDESARRPPCGGRCERFGAKGCHSPRCRVGGQ